MIITCPLLAQINNAKPDSILKPDTAAKVNSATNTDNKYTEIIIADFKLSNKSILVGEKINGRIILDKPISETKNIILENDENSFSFRFRPLSGAVARKTKCEYMLEGFDKDWFTKEDDRNFVTYTNLKQGKYIFKLKSYLYNSRQEKQTLINIEIKPNFLSTWGINILMLFVLIIGFIIFYILRVRIINIRNARLETRVLKRTETIAAQKEILTKQSDDLLIANNQLEERQQEIEAQKEELNEQAILLKKNNKELENHRDHLEILVKERTVDLEIAKVKAEEADHLKSSFLTNMSHEIRTPLNAIVGFSSILAATELDPETKKQYITLIEKSSNNLTKLIEDIIDFSKLESNQLKIIPEKCSLASLLDELHNGFKVFIKQHRKDIALIINEKNQNNNLIIEADTLRLKQILSNLINNAIKHTDEGYVEYGYDIMPNNILRFYVKDTGTGIAEEDQKVIFDRFRKIEKSKTKLYRGIGLGLSISKRLIEMMNGKIWLKSYVNQGSEFYFSIPYSPMLIKKKIIKTEKKTDKICLLLAEDEEANYLYIKALLRNKPVTLFWAKNGKHAVELFIEHTEIKLVLMDIKMPIMNGIEAVKKIREKNKITPIIALTAYAMPEEKKEILDAGCTEYLSKPVKANVLIKTMSEFLPIEL